jgi:outer membrane protein
MKRDCCLFLLIIIIISLPAIAQEKMNLNLQDAIDIALNESTGIQRLQQSIISAERRLWAAKAGYRTNMTMDITAPEYQEGFQLIQVVGDNPVAERFGSYKVKGVLNLTQPMPWIPLGGASMWLASEAYQLNNWIPSPTNPDEQIKNNKFYTSLSLNLNKPLFTINELALGLRSAELNYQRNTRRFNRFELDLIYNVTDHFYRLYRHTEDVLITEEKVKRQEEIYQTTRNRFKAGLIAEVDTMQAEVELIEYQNELKQKQDLRARQEASFKQLIGLPLEKVVDVTTDLDIKRLHVDVERAVGLARENRSEIVEQKIDIEDQKINIKRTDARVSIQGDLNAYYDLAGFSDRAMPYGANTQELFRSSWNELKDTPNRGFMFNLQVPIWDWGRNKAQVDEQKAYLRMSELDLKDIYVDIEREVRDLVRNIELSWDRVQMLEKSRRVSEHSFEISLKRFDNGDINSTELARAQDQWNAAKLSYLNAYVGYQLALADLKRKTLYDFENDRSLVKTDLE